MPKVSPGRVVRLDEVELPGSSPLLDLLLSGNGAGHVMMHLEVDQPMDSVAFGEALDFIASMLPCSLQQVTCDANIQSPVALAGEELDRRLFRSGRHGATVIHAIDEGRLDSQPEQCTTEGHDSSVVTQRLLVSGGKPACLLQQAESAFDF